MLGEMENLQSQIQQAKHATEINHLTAENLKREVSAGFYPTTANWYKAMYDGIICLFCGMSLSGTLALRPSQL